MASGPSRPSLRFEMGSHRDVAISCVSSESDRSLQVRAELPLSVGQRRGPVIDPPYHRCSLEHGDQEVGDRMWVNLRIDLSGWPAAFSRSISGNQIHAPRILHAPRQISPFLLLLQLVLQKSQSLLEKRAVILEDRSMSSIRKDAQFRVWQLVR